jgi:ribosome-binding protein aMBF1 (putative translation factor)
MHDLTQKQLGDLIGESAGVIYRFENSSLRHHKKNISRIEVKMEILERGDCVE